MDGIFLGWFARMLAGFAMVFLALLALHASCARYETLSARWRFLLCATGFLLIAVGAATLTLVAVEMGAFARA